MQYLFFISILPVALLLFFVYKRDDKKEPTKMLVKAFLLGSLVSIPIVIVELLLAVIIPKEIIGYRLIDALLGVALIEEGFKWLVMKSIYKKDDFDETYDGIVYSVFVSLGFAAVENILYVFTKGMGTGILRALTAVPGHAYYAVIMGYYFGLAKTNKIFNNKKFENRFLLLSIVIPTLLHAIYDFLLVQNLLVLLIWLCFLIAVSIYSVVLVFKASKNNYHYYKNKYCTMCGHNVEGMKFCEECGSKNE